MADQPDQPPSSEQPIEGHRVTNVPGGDVPPPAADQPTKALIDNLLGAGPLTATPLTATPIMASEPPDDLRSELGLGSGQTIVDPRVNAEGAAPLTAEVIARVDSLAPEVAAHLVVGPSPDPAKIRPDASPLHRKTVPAQTVAEATAKARTTPLPGTEGTAAPPVDPEEAKKLLKAELDRIITRLKYGEEITKEIKPELNPLNDREFQRFVRSHLSHLLGFYVVTGQPVGELRAEANEKALADAESLMMKDVDPSLANHPAAKLAVSMGWQPNAPIE